MPNYSNAKFAINRKTQVDKDTIKVDDLVRYPILFGNGSGFVIAPDADTFDDVVDPIMENTKTQILGAQLGGQVTTPADADFLALHLASILGTINTTNPVSGVYSHAISPSNAAAPNFHTSLYSDGTCDQRLVGLVPSSVSFGADFNNRRMNAGVSYAGIRGEDNDGANTGTVTVANATDIWSRATHGYLDGEAVMLSNSGGALPAGTNNTTVYYVEVIDAGTFYLHSTWQGSVAHLTTDRVDATDDGTGTQTVTKVITAYPAQSTINPFQFTMPGASLLVDIDGAGAVDWTQYFAGFQYGLQDVVSAEQRAGSNTIRAIERINRVQSLALMLDYTDTTFKDIIRQYQSRTTPNTFDITLVLQGQQIASTAYNYKLTMRFYNCNLLNHSPTRTPEINKQELPFQVNHDLSQGKSVDITIVNDVASYLT